MTDTTAVAALPDGMPDGLPDDLPVDVHQHLWPEPLLEALRARSAPPYLDGWTLHTATDAPSTIDPGDHDPERRTAWLVEAGRTAVVSPSSPLGAEDLPLAESRRLLDATHEGLEHLGDRLGWWASLPRELVLHRVDDAQRALADVLDRGAAGLQVPATWLTTPADVAALTPVLSALQEADRPLFVHPGPPRGPVDAPVWWAPVVDYTAQMAASWWAWHAAGRAALPQLRICFAAGAGLAPVQHERLRARGGDSGPVDPLTFVELSSYGVQAFDALMRSVGIDVLVAASDHPYATALELPRDPAAHHALHHTNPHRLLSGGTP